MPSDADRGWFRTHLVPYRAGLLTNDEEDRFRRIVLSDPSCRREFELSVDDDDVDLAVEEGHLSAWVIARWPDLRPKFRGLERRLVRLHLESCAKCREELQFLGHEATLELDEAPDGTRDVDPSAVSVSGPGARRWREWIGRVLDLLPKSGRAVGGGALVGFAAATAVVLLVVGESPMPGVISIPGDLRPYDLASRSDATVDVESGVVALIVPPLELDPTGEVNVRWTFGSTSNSSAQQRNLSPVQVSDRILVLEVPPGAWDSLVVRVVQSGDEVARWDLRVRTPPR